MEHLRKMLGARGMMTVIVLCFTMIANGLLSTKFKVFKSFHKVCAKVEMEHLKMMLGASKLGTIHAIVLSFSTLANGFTSTNP